MVHAYPFCEKKVSSRIHTSFHSFQFIDYPFSSARRFLRFRTISRGIPLFRSSQKIVMSIRYKSKTEKSFSSINIPESFISALELKSRLIKKENIDMGRDFKFILTDESGEHGWLEEVDC